MKKFFSLLAAVLMVGSMWAVAPTFEVTNMPSGNLDSINAIASAKGVTITTSKGKLNGNNEGHWYVSCDSSATATGVGYFGISATQKIDSISFLVSGNSATATAWLVVCGWKETPSTTLDYFFNDQANTLTTAKSYADAQWITEKFDTCNLKAVNIYRQVSANVFTYKEAAVAKTGNGKTFNVFGVRVYLHEETPAPVAKDTVFFVNTKGWATPYFYDWDEAGNTSAKWHGTLMTKTDYQLQGADVYYYATDVSEYANFLFNDGISAQTGNQTWAVAKGKYYCKGYWYTKAELASTIVPLVYTKGNWDSWAKEDTLVANAAKDTCSVVKTLEAGSYAFKIVDDDVWLGNDGTMTRDNCTGWVMTASTSSNCTLTADVAGDYTFTYAYATKALSVTFPAEPEPTIPTYTVTELLQNAPADSAKVMVKGVVTKMQVAKSANFTKYKSAMIWVADTAGVPDKTKTVEFYNCYSLSKDSFTVSSPVAGSSTTTVDTLWDAQGNYLVLGDTVTAEGLYHSYGDQAELCPKKDYSYYPYLTEIKHYVAPIVPVSYDTVHYVAGNFTNWENEMIALPTNPINFGKDSALHFKQVDVVTKYEYGIEQKKDTLWLGASDYDNAMTRTSNAWKLDGTYNVNLTTDVAGEYSFALVDGLFTVTFPGIPVSYEKVTAAPANWCGEYVIAATASDGKALVWTGVDAGQCRDSVEVSEGVITGAFVSVTIDTLGTGYSIKVNGGANDGKYISSGTATPAFANGLKFIDAPALVDIAFKEDGTVSLSQTIDKILGDEKDSIVYFVYNSNTGASNERYRFYKSTSLGDKFFYPCLYKKAVEPEPTATDIYVMGIASWSASDEYKMTETVLGSEWTYDFGTTELVGKTFKFATADWSTVNLGQDTEGLKEGTIAVKQGSNTNISVASNYSSATNVVVTLKKDAEGNWTVTAAGTFVEGTPAIPDLYLRGINGSWEATDANKFTKDAEKDEWTLTIGVTDVTKKFKVADASWGSYNFGAGTDALVLDAAYTLVSGGGDIALPADAAAGNYTFTVVKGEDVWTLMDVWKLTVSKNTTAVEENADAAKAQKMLINGQIVIRKGAKLFNAQGLEF